jgi:hypothetical protein
MKIKLAAIIEFLYMAQRDGWTLDFILQQLHFVHSGTRDERLHDNMIVLIEAIED